MGSHIEYWCGLPFPSPGDLPDPGIEHRSPELLVDSLLSGPPGKLDGAIILDYSVLSRRVLNEITCVFKRVQAMDMWKSWQRRTQCVAETGIMTSQYRKYWQPPEAWRGRNQTVPESLQREEAWSASAVTLAQGYWFWTSGLQNCEKVNFYCFKLQVRDFLWYSSG